ncbi:hypothetical protein IOQ59_11530 [Pontibacterium sp. N1Y112]|uniref:Uncharacterized protein n=1 Tax=Pontibacterium sinense TaxID=2781979 RepID=A0A8J7JZL3_9GAMM|nr:hypothetical protein [Pontibacterium sinense]MBE9397889.1 hypothetical protein [Pontibacterium sinense]
MIPNNIDGLSWAFDHISLNTTPDAKAVTDLMTLFALEDGFRPPFPFSGRWLYQEDKPVWHLIVQPEGNSESVHLNHIAFRGVTASGQPTAKQTQTVINTLKHLNLPFHTANVPDEDMLQIFVRISAELMIELDLPLHSTIEQTKAPATEHTIKPSYHYSPDDQTPHGDTFS